MNFCDECDSLLQPKKVNGKVIPFCPDCDEFKEGTVSNSKIEVPNDDERKTDPEGGKMLILQDEDNRTVGRPSREIFCSNCQSMQDVEYWEIQTRSADESPTRFFRCLNCDKNWREYD